MTQALSLLPRPHVVIRILFLNSKSYSYQYNNHPLKAETSNDKNDNSNNQDYEEKDENNNEVVVEKGDIPKGEFSSSSSKYLVSSKGPSTLVRLLEWKRNISNLRDMLQCYNADAIIELVGFQGELCDLLDEDKTEQREEDEDKSRSHVI